ncbi:hypothetical protein LCGC14_1275150 [marine sediment metagenome]|uniref:Uncharacterized protein n=1 Tax=marine sediment metagenome TaxID=412755 RepID=A0A0F9LI71_9ZZZZ
MAEKRGRVSSKRSMGTKYKNLDKKFKVFIVFGIIFLVAGIPLIVWGGITAYNAYAIGGETPVETPTTKLYSTFALISNVDGEIVSPFVEVDIWGPKDSADFSLGMEDITDLTTNFERIETNADADDVEIDLRDELYYWLEITGNSLFQNTFFLLYGGANYDYIKAVHDPSSAMPFNIFVKNTGAAITIPGHQTNGNFTGVLDVPINSRTAANLHYGDNWALSTTEFAALAERQQKPYWDEGNWCDQFPSYDPTLDTVNEYDRAWEKITNAPALKFVMNDTISVIDGEATQINTTIGRGYSIDFLVSGVNLYMAWYEGIDFDPSPYTFDFEMTFGVNITITTVYSGRADVYGAFSSLAWDTTYNEIGLVAA